MQGILDDFHFYIQSVLIEESNGQVIGQPVEMSKRAQERILKEAQRITFLYGNHFGKEEFEKAIQKVITDTVV